MVKNENRKVAVMEDNNKRMSISVSANLEQSIADLRKTDRFCRASYAEIIRTLMVAGLEKLEEVQSTEPGGEGRAARGA
jgi:hypothetical protein